MNIPELTIVAALLLVGAATATIAFSGEPMPPHQPDCRAIIQHLSDTPDGWREITLLPDGRYCVR